MIIEKVEFAELHLMMRKPYTIAYETISEATNFILRITTVNGLQGYGCAAPDLIITGENPEDVKSNIENMLIPYLEGKNPFMREQLMNEMRMMTPGCKSTLAMVDIALYDLLARRAKLPLYMLLGGNRKSIPTCVTIGIMTVDETLREAREILQQGFNILKIKGGISVDMDIERIIKIREHFGQQIILRFDGNQGYSADDTIKFIKELHPYGVEILEQPMGLNSEIPHILQGPMTKVPIMADESLKHLGDAFRIAKNQAIDMVNIKIQKVGGLEQALHINSVAKAAGNEVMVGCMDECKLGIASGLHFALSRPNVQYADLDAHLDFVNDPFKGLFKIEKGVMYPYLQSGLGEINEEVLDRF
ncbi:mandelate racemase/muconate lactonizing enzyme family protein [Portibacter marinus]|uniref:mandelate racemase/muconate lactonizing enzyme family protein n=1 Tax=Portibacter marinus TaxID=2898660 RepID=UPI001F17925F|nr:dipeptide epimerase [Portibacter marinus]